MSGIPGSGKSTIAQAIAGTIDAAILDHDDTKSAILSVGIEGDLAGRASYEVIKVLAGRALARGDSVIIDSPCMYDPLLEYGIASANTYGATYRYIECQLEDLEILNQRLEQRESKPSQMRSVAGSISHGGKSPREATQLLKEWASSMKRPSGGFLLLDTRDPVDVCAQVALQYVLSA